MEYLPQKVLLFQAVTVNDADLFSKVETLFKRFYGDIEMSFGPYDFSLFSQYYKDEMGEDLKKKFYVFKELVSLENFYRLKYRRDV
jgi:hypothetical protein